MSNEETPLVEMGKKNKIGNGDDKQKGGNSVQTPFRPQPDPPMNTTDETTEDGQRDEADNKDNNREASNATTEKEGKRQTKPKPTAETTEDGQRDEADNKANKRESKATTKKEGKKQTNPKPTAETTEDGQGADTDSRGIRESTTKPQKEGQLKPKSASKSKTTSSLRRNVLPSIETSEGKTVAQPKEEKQSSNTSSNEEQKDTLCAIREGYVLQALMAVLLIVIIPGVLSVSITRDILNVKPCELEKALESINLTYNPHPCKYNVIKEKTTFLFWCGVAVLIWNSALFVAILCIYQCRCRHEMLVLRILSGVVLGSAAIFVGFICSLYINVIGSIDEDQNFDYIKLQSKMVSLLEQQYKSDNISTGDENSRNWNIFFIQYDCCAIREVQSTTNDFDNTPWCTTSGTCADTASQIPKTCCKDVDLGDYQNAPKPCHASVDPGTFKPSCISRMRALSTVNISECQFTYFCLSELMILVFKILEIILGVLLLVLTFIAKNHASNNKKKK